MRLRISSLSAVASLYRILRFYEKCFPLHVYSQHKPSNVVLSDPVIEQAGNISQDFYHCFTDNEKCTMKTSSREEKMWRRESVDF